MKICLGCGLEKPKSEFSKHKLGKEGLRPRCKKCCLLEQNIDRKTNGYRALIKYRYGITYEEYLKFIDDQGSRCRICNVLFDNTKRNTKPCVDHNHTTGRVRSILCHSCNVSLGLLKEDIDILQNMIKYIQNDNTG